MNEPSPLAGDVQAGPLPTFLIIGAPKAGTTTLSDYLGAHPDVYVPPRKELHFFTKHYGRGEGWYREQFAPGAGARAVGEASPGYLFRLEAHERMASMVPDAKLVAILRNPADRAYSHYWYWRSLGVIKDTFEEMIRREVKEEAGAFPLLLIGRYASQIEHLLRYYPRESLLVMLLDDLRARTDEATRELCAFVGVPPTPMPQSEAKNAAMEFRSLRLFRAMRRFGAWKRLPFDLGRRIDALNRKKLVYPPMGGDIRREIIDRFSADNERLAGLLGRDLSAWSL